MTDIVKQDNQPLAHQESEVTRLIRFALEQGQNPTELYAILSKERERAELQSYNRAKGAFLEACPKIVEKKIGGGLTKNGKEFKFAYADLGDIVEQAFPYLRELGFSWDFSLVVLADNKQYQRCFLRHRDGYVHTADVPYLADSGGHMNAVQQVGSGLSYSERYALLQALGLPTCKVDADSPKRPMDNGKISENDARDLNDALIAVQADIPAFKKWLKVENLADLPKSRLAEAHAGIEAKRSKLGVKK